MPEIIDSFEDGDISEYSGATDWFSTSTSNPYHGSYNLASSSENRHLYREDVSVTTDDTPLGAWVQGKSEEIFGGNEVYNIGGITWGVNNATSFPDSGDYYYAVISASNDFELGVCNSGSFSTLGISSPSISAGTYYKIEVSTWGNGDVGVDLIDTSGNVISSLSHADDTITSGGIGFIELNAGASIGGIYDYYYKKTPLSAPSNLHFNDTLTEDELTLDWDTSGTGASGYYVYRAQLSGSSKSDYTQVADVTGPPYTDTGLEDSERYYYRVSSYN